MTWEAQTASHADCFAWLFPAWLAQILLLIKSQTQGTYKSHRYTSHLKYHIAQHRNNTYAHSCSLHIHTGELKRPAVPEYFFRAQVIWTVFLASPWGCVNRLGRSYVTQGDRKSMTFPPSPPATVVERRPWQDPAFSQLHLSWAGIVSYWPE